MGIQLTASEMGLVKAGKLDVTKIEEYRKDHPVPSINLNEVEKIKQDIRDALKAYQDSIARNKDLYKELEENRKHKEQMRKNLEALRKKKKEILGTG